ncbi:unnamed protein product [Urochloa decumbens]|uniref:KIB1-4 beta-propeller domain-containing protein n=1 Tax=Urochloa decumbens TaxID=240449 RepID=A0ABC9ATK9_9POAL
MDSGTRNSGKVLDRMPPCLSKQEIPRQLGSRTAMGLGADTSGEVFDETPRKRSKLETDVAVLSWASLPSDILGVVLGLLPCFADRANVGAVCHHWRSAGCSQILQGLHSPLQLLVLPKFKFWCLCSDVPKRAAWSVQMPQEVAADALSLMGFLGTLIRLSQSCQWTMASCVVVASSYHGLTQTLALWQPGMNSWHVCNGLPIVGPKDLAFHQGKLYVLLRFMPRLYAFELEEGGHGVVVSRVEHCVIDPLRNHRIQRWGELIYNIVVWRDNLLLITRSFDGDCVFVDSCGCNSFPAGLHGDEGDLVYFVDQYRKYDISNFNPSYDTFVYNVRNGTTRPFAVELSPNNFGAPNGKLDVPVWLLTSK